MSSYAEIQAKKNAQAAKDYRAVLSNLPPEVRAILEGKDEHGKTVLRMDDSFKGNHRKVSTAEEEGEDRVLEPSENPDYAAKVDSLADTLSEKFDLTEGQAAGIVEWHRAVVADESLRGLSVRLARLTGVLLNHSNLNLVAHALAYATHTAKANGLGSMRECCKRILKPDGTSVGVAALSKMACWLVGFLDLPPGEGMKSEEAVESYRGSAKRGHEKRRSNKLSRALSRLDRAPQSSTPKS